MRRTFITLLAILIFPPVIFRFFPPWQGIYITLGFLFVVWWTFNDASRKLQITLDLPETRGDVGSSFSCKVSITNPASFPVHWLTLRHNFPGELGGGREQALISLAPNQTKEIEINFLARQRGVYSLPDTQVSMGEAWGIRDINYIWDNTAEKIIVNPPLSAIKGLQPQTSSPTKASIGIFLNMDPADYPFYDLDAMAELNIEFAASLVKIYGREKQRLVLLNNMKFPYLAEEPDQEKKEYLLESAEPERLMAVLAGVNPDKSGAASHLFPAEIPGLDKGSPIFMITPCLSPQISGQAGQWSKNGYKPVLVLPSTSDGYGKSPGDNLQNGDLTCLYIERGESREFICKPSSC